MGGFSPRFMEKDNMLFYLKVYPIVKTEKRKKVVEFSLRIRECLKSCLT